MLEVDRDLARARVEALLRVAALRGEPLDRARRELALRDPGAREDHVDEHRVEVVAAELVHAGRRHHVVRAPAHPHERRVERPAPQVVHDNVIALARERVAMAMRVLEPRRRRLVEHRRGREPGAPEGVERDEALRAVRVRGHRDDRAHRVLALLLLRSLRQQRARVRARRDRLPERAEEAREQVRHGEPGRPDGDARVRHRARIGEPPLEAPDDAPARVVRQRERVEAESQLPARSATDRRIEVVRVPRFVVEADDRIIAAVRARHHSARRPEIDRRASRSHLHRPSPTSPRLAG